MAAPPGIVTLLTDFGLDDPFVGVMKGVILSRFADAKIVDLAHGVHPQDVIEGAFWLSRCARHFPPGTVHVAVVDPGVGSDRAPVVVQGAAAAFVGPDNGLLAGLGDQVRRIELSSLPEPSATFHGRDVFAPVGALLASGELAFEDVGPEAALEVPSPLPAATVASEGIDGVVVSVDRFGNLITNIEADDVRRLRSPHVRLGALVRPVRRTYAEADAGDFVAVINAFGTLEVAKRDGNAERTLEAGRGAAVRVESR